MGTIESFKVGQRVKYIPMHVDGDEWHPDCETGTVSSVGEKNVFVKFDKKVVRHGMDGTTAEACDPEDLKIV